MTTRAKKMLELSKANNPELIRKSATQKPRANKPPTKYETALEKSENFVKNLPEPRQGVKRRMPESLETKNMEGGSSSKNKKIEKENAVPKEKYAEPNQIETTTKQNNEANENVTFGNLGFMSFQQLHSPTSEHNYNDELLEVEVDSVEETSEAVGGVEENTNAENETVAMFVSTENTNAENTPKIAPANLKQPPSKETTTTAENIIFAMIDFINQIPLEVIEIEKEPNQKSKESVTNKSGNDKIASLIENFSVETSKKQVKEPKSKQSREKLKTTTQEISQESDKGNITSLSESDTVETITVKTFKTYFGKPTQSPRTVKKTIKSKPKSKRAAQQSFKNGYLTLKNNLKYLQVKNGFCNDFLLIVKNNSQNIEKFGSSKSATKYLSFGAGTLKSKFFSSEGVSYNPTEYFLVKDDETLDEDVPLTLKMIKKLHKTESDIDTDNSKTKRNNSKSNKSAKMSRQIVQNQEQEVSQSSTNASTKHTKIKRNKTITVNERKKSTQKKRIPKKLKINFDKLSTTDSEESTDIFDMKAIARKVITPGGNPSNESSSVSFDKERFQDYRIFSYGAGARQKASKELKKQRKEQKKKRKKTTENETIDILSPIKESKNKGKGAKSSRGGKGTKSIK